MKNTDTLQRFIFEDTDIRGEIVHLNHSFQTIMQQHKYPPAVFNLLAECLVAAVLLSATLKYRGQLTLQFQGNGPLKMLVAKCNEKFEIRGLAQFDENRVSNQNSTSLLGTGQLVVTVDQGKKVNSYQSIIPLQHKSIAENLEDYFGQSVQISTKIWLAVNENSAAGMLLQLLPNKQHSALHREQFWEHAVKLGETISNQELLELDNPTILHRLYHQENVRLFDPEKIKFRCQCSQKRMENVIKLVGRTEIESILAEHQVVDIKCEYCNKTYTFDRDAAEKILHGSAK
jgi:molecular chaperone Hsp33